MVEVGVWKEFKNSQGNSFTNVGKELVLCMGRLKSAQYSGFTVNTYMDNLAS